MRQIIIGITVLGLLAVSDFGFAQATKPSNPKVIVTISVDWEGATIQEENLKAFTEFRDEFPDVPLTQFLNAAYYLRKDSAESISDKIRSVVRENDELGLHIHSWRFLVEKAEVEFRKGPRFWSADTPIRLVQGDEGHDVELGAYNPDEVTKIAKASQKILAEQGFQLSNSFRAGGWVAPESVLIGIRQAGFLVDSSATDRTWHRDELEKYPIFDRLGELWPDITQHSQPYLVETTAGRDSGNARYLCTCRLRYCR